MKKRISFWFNSLLISYIPSVQKIAQIEARRIVRYIVENYSMDEQKYILDEMSINLIEHRKQEIEDKIIELEKNEAELVSLNENLEKLIVK